MMILVIVFFIVFFGIAIYLSRMLDRKDAKRLKGKGGSQF